MTVFPEIKGTRRLLVVISTSYESQNKNLGDCTGLLPLVSIFIYFYSLLVKSCWSFFEAKTVRLGLVILEQADMSLSRKNPNIF